MPNSVTSHDLQWLREVFNDMKHCVVSLRQPSFLYYGVAKNSISQHFVHAQCSCTDTQATAADQSLFLAFCWLAAMIKSIFSAVRVGYLLPLPGFGPIVPAWQIFKQFIQRQQAPIAVWKWHSLRNLFALHLFSCCKPRIINSYSIKAMIA